MTDLMEDFLETVLYDEPLDEYVDYNETDAEDAEEVLKALLGKHLPGKHDQQSHAGGLEGHQLHSMDVKVDKELIAGKADELKKKWTIPESLKNRITIISDGVKTDKAIDDLFKGTLAEGITEEQIVAAYCGGLDELPENMKFTISIGVVDRAVESGIHVKISGKEESSLTSSVVASRIITRNKFENTGVKVYHSLFEIDKDYQNSGVGSDFFYKSEEAYKDFGVSSISVHANISIGGYAWARMGFDFADSDRVRAIQDLKSRIRRSLRTKFYDKYDNLNLARRKTGGKLVETVDQGKNAIEWALKKLDLDSYEYPFQFAAVTLKIGGQDWAIGKEVMIGSDWEGVKLLNNDSFIPSVIGDEYKELRKKKVKKSSLVMSDKGEDGPDAADNEADEAWRLYLRTKVKGCFIDVDEFEIMEEKHLPGKHNQKTHGGSVTHTTLSYRAEEILEKGLKEGTYVLISGKGSDNEGVIATLEHAVMLGTDIGRIRIGVVTLDITEKELEKISKEDPEVEDAGRILTKPLPPNKFLSVHWTRPSKEVRQRMKERTPAQYLEGTKQWMPQWRYKDLSDVINKRDFLNSYVQSIVSGLDYSALIEGGAVQKLKSLIGKIKAFVLIVGGEKKSNIDESTDGVSNAQTEILYEIETSGGNVSDVFWEQYKEEIVEMEHEELIEPLDVSGYGLIGQTVRTLKLTPKGRLAMLIGRMQTAGSISS